MLDRVSTVVLGLDGRGGAESFADYSQWEAWQAERKQKSRLPTKAQETAGSSASTAPAAKKKLSYLEAREFATLEDRIAQAEQALQAKQAAAEDPAIGSDAARLLTAHAEMEEAQKVVDELYARWADLEEKQN